MLVTVSWWAVVDNRTNDLLIYLGVVAIIAIVSHVLIRRFIVSCGVIVLLSSFFNLLHEIATTDAALTVVFRPASVVFWLPAMFLQGVGLAIPIAVLIGAPFLLLKTRRH